LLVTDFLEDSSKLLLLIATKEKKKTCEITGLILSICVTSKHDQKKKTVAPSIARQLSD
jgi:hypothetical protein